MSQSERKERPHRLTVQDIFLLLNMNDMELVNTLSRPAFGLEKFIKTQQYCSKNDKIEFETFVNIMAASSRMCTIRCGNRLGSVEKFLYMITSCKKFLFEDALRVIYTCLERKQRIDLASFTKNYIIVLKTIVRHQLHSTEDVTDIAFPALQNILNDMKVKRVRNFEEVNEEYGHLKKLVERRDVSFLDENEDDGVVNFRQLSIMPKDDDVINCEISDLPCNKIDGPYNSVDYYLSVHFRLMREDMLRMFRACIAQHSNPSEYNRSSAKTYELVNVEYPPIYKPDGIYYKIKVTSSKPIDWSKKDVLMPGNIVCLTHNNYRSVAFAIVSAQPKADKGKCIECTAEVKMEDTYDEVLKDDVNYLMFETTAYFECYRHVLGAIKEFNKNSFPLSDIIVRLNFEHPEPEYMVDPSFKNVKYCLHEKCDGSGKKSLMTNTPDKDDENDMASGEDQQPKNTETVPNKPLNENGDIEDDSCECTRFNPLNYNEWPSAEELKLDDQQLEAFETALTRKVAVIQGPPGTGKTFIGVKVVKALLENLPLRPIVICCLTNHALDQFLEHISKFTKNIIRLGSQSKSNILEPHTLENLMFAYRSHSRDDKSSVLNMDKIMRESLNHLKMFVPDLLKSNTTGEFDKKFNDISDICNEINSLYIRFYKCKDEFLEDTALNEMIGMEAKEQLRSGSKTISKSLSSSVLEWLCCPNETELYTQCENRFPKLEKSIFSNNLNEGNLWSLELTKRFQMLFVWRRKCMTLLRKYINDDREEYKKLRSTYNGRLPDAVKVDILRGSHVIGVTTTGAAKYRRLLRFTDAKILIVEEAAEVLESHIISSLLPTTQHMILIGDHKQLRPLPADHELSEVYNLKISMFERLFQNNAPSATLVSQHRMKPCIADLLIQEELYTDLKSYENVFKYEEIKGVKSSVFFVNHNKAENSMSSGTSASNDYEAIMIAHLAKYLVRMSYTEDAITVLATYAAQVPLIQKYLEEMTLSISVTTVDNYQGEENDIILISFVRSNISRLIGFLKENNRVCVALSRARKGMFCFGNFDSYSSRSPLWQSIVSKLVAQEMIGPKLPLTCSKHLKETCVESPDDINELLRRGCDDMCGFQLPCGHLCSRKCHYNDPEHTRYQCTMPCEKYISESKKCSRLCHQRCKRSKKLSEELPCGHLARFRKDNSVITVCEEEIQRMLPCKHIDTLPCSTDVSSYKCKAIVPIILPCGHKKNVLCHKSTDLNHVFCNDLTPRESPCGHTVEVPCSLIKLEVSELLAFCKNCCDKLLNCGHACIGDCCWCSDIGIHALCTEKCEERLNCGHICIGYCKSPCLPCTEKCLLSCSHNTNCINSCYRPCNTCKEPCERRCIHGSCRKKCFEPCSVKACSLPCKEKLPCGHTCIGLCGDPCPYLCRVCHPSDLSPKSIDDPHVQLDDCDHVIAVDILNDHINECLECFLWPDCPVCKKPITKSLRYKEQLRKAKQAVLLSNDNSTEIENVHYLLNSMVSSNMIVPAEFLGVHQEITNILDRDKPTSSLLCVLDNCLRFLMELLRISQKLKKMEPCELTSVLQNRFETLLLWICNHLEFASYQQLNEMEQAVEELKNNFIWSSNREL